MWNNLNNETLIICKRMYLVQLSVYCKTNSSPQIVCKYRISFVVPYVFVLTCYFRVLLYGTLPVCFTNYVVHRTRIVCTVHCSIPDIPHAKEFKQDIYLLYHTSKKLTFKIITLYFTVSKKCKNQKFAAEFFLSIKIVCETDVRAYFPPSHFSLGISYNTQYTQCRVSAAFLEFHIFARGRG